MEKIKPSLDTQIKNIGDYIIESQNFTLKVHGKMEDEEFKCYIDDVNDVYLNYLKVEKQNVIGINILDIKDELSELYYNLVKKGFYNFDKENISIILRKENNNYKIVNLKDMQKCYGTFYKVNSYTLTREKNLIKVLLVISNVNRELNLKKEKNTVEDIKNYNDKIMSMSDVITNLSHSWRQPLNSLNFSIINLIDEIDVDDSGILDEYYKEIWQIMESLSDKIEKFRSFFEMNDEKNFFSVEKYLNMVFEIMEEKIKKDHIKIDVIMGEKIRKYGSSNEFVQIMYCIFFDIIEYCKNVLDIYNRKISIEIHRNKKNILFNIKIIFDKSKYRHFKLCLNHLSMFNNIIHNKMNGFIKLTNTEIKNELVIGFPLDVEEV
ncbi:hypothetical protein [Dethiothermospora halolimnae]|uniref:hypothetical protein n=1 Tax=Dethiothermospora halolimnae TaxID=3114390 RepID=UPI003CCBAF0F